MFRKKKPGKGYLKVVENKGQGDCLFYSIANGLIPYLQKEIKALYGESEKWSMEDIQLKQIDIRALDVNKINFNLVNADSILGKLMGYIDEHAELKMDKNQFLTGVIGYEFNYNKIKVSDFLTQFNYLLRHMLYHLRLNDFNISMRDGSIRGNIAFMNVLSIYYGSPELVVDEDFKTDGQLRKDISEFKNHFKDEYDEETLIKLLVPYCFGNSETRKKVLDDKKPIIENIDEQSTVGKILHKKLRKGQWGTENDAVRLGEFIGFQPDIHVQGVKTPGNIDTSIPAIKINNLFNIHWNTLFNPFYKADSISEEMLASIVQYKDYATEPDLTKYEIRGVFKNYNNIFGNRHHKQFASEILEYCRREAFALDAIMDYIIAGSPEHRKGGDLSKRLNYLCFRYKGASYDDLKAAWSAANEVSHSPRRRGK